MTYSIAHAPSPTIPTGWLPISKAAKVLGWSRHKLHHANVAGEVPEWAKSTIQGHTHYSGLWCAGFKTPPPVVLTENTEAP